MPAVHRLPWPLCKDDPEHASGVSHGLFWHMQAVHRPTWPLVAQAKMTQNIQVADRPHVLF